MTRKTQKKLRKLLTLVCCAVMLVCVSVGATLAYLTSQDAVTNTFTVGKVVITMDEADVDENGDLIYKTDAEGNVTNELAERVKENTYKLMPGHEYIKDPTIHVGTENEDAYLGLKVTISNASETDKLFGTNSGVNITDVLVGLNTTKWDITSTVTDNVRTYIFIYTDTITKTTGDIKVFDKVKIPGSITNAELDTLQNTQMTINAYAVQKDGFDTAAEALNAGFSDVFPEPVVVETPVEGEDTNA